MTGGRNGKGYGVLATPFRCVAFHDTLLHTEKPPYRFLHTAADGLFAEQVAVRPGAGKRQNQHIILDTVNEQPVRKNVTFPMAHPIAGQIVIAVFLRQRFTHRQQRHDLSGDWVGHRECHILPDWLLIYRIEDDVLVLTLARTGTHSDLFDK